MDWYFVKINKGLVLSFNKKMACEIPLQINTKLALFSKSVDVFISGHNVNNRFRNLTKNAINYLLLSNPVMDHSFETDQHKITERSRNSQFNIGLEVSTKLIDSNDLRNLRVESCIQKISSKIKKNITEKEIPEIPQEATLATKLLKTEIAIRFFPIDDPISTYLSADYETPSYLLNVPDAGNEKQFKLPKLSIFGIESDTDEESSDSNEESYLQFPGGERCSIIDDKDFELSACYRDSGIQTVTVNLFQMMNCETFALNPENPTLDDYDLSDVKFEMFENEKLSRSFNHFIGYDVNSCVCDNGRSEHIKHDDWNDFMEKYTTIPSDHKCSNMDYIHEKFRLYQFLKFMLKIQHVDIEKLESNDSNALSDLIGNSIQLKIKEEMAELIKSYFKSTKAFTLISQTNGRIHKYKNTFFSINEEIPQDVIDTIPKAKVEYFSSNQSEMQVIESWFWNRQNCDQFDKVEKETTFEMIQTPLGDVKKAISSAWSFISGKNSDKEEKEELLLDHKTGIMTKNYPTSSTNLKQESKPQEEYIIGYKAAQSHSSTDEDILRFTDEKTHIVIITLKIPLKGNLFVNDEGTKFRCKNVIPIKFQLVEIGPISQILKKDIGNANEFKHPIDEEEDVPNEGKQEMPLEFNKEEEAIREKYLITFSDLDELNSNINSSVTDVKMEMTKEIVERFKNMTSQQLFHMFKSLGISQTELDKFESVTKEYGPDQTFSQILAKVIRVSMILFNS